MITLVPEILFSLIISVLGSPTLSGDHSNDQERIRNFVESNGPKDINRPTEALGGGYKRY